MKNINFSILIVGLALIALPVSVGAISSANYQLDPTSGYMSTQGAASGGDYYGASANYQLQGSVDQFAGNLSGGSFNLESGDSFEYYCGDGIQDAGEFCDGVDLNGSTCAAQGFDSGTLACSATCTFDTSSCSNNAGGGGGGGGGGVMVPNAPTVDESIKNLEFSYESTMILFGEKASNVTTVKINSSSDDVEYPTMTSWKKTIALDYGLNTFSLMSSNNSGNSSELAYEIYRRLVGDITEDDSVNDYDLSRLIVLWGGDDVAGDFNVDGGVDDYDFSMMVARWGTSL